MQTEEAEALALQALTFLLAEESLRDRFLAMSGLTGDTLASRLGDPDFLAAILGFFAGHEPDLLALAEGLKIAPEKLVGAWHSLGGSLGHEY